MAEGWRKRVTGLFARPKDPVSGMLSGTSDRAAAPKLRLKAQTAGDLAVISALTANAVGLVSEARYAARARRMTFQISRYRHEGRNDPDALGLNGERVSAMLEIRGALRAQARGLAGAQAYEILALTFEPTAPESVEDPGENPGGTLRVVCADSVGFALEIEMLEVLLTDMSEPWAAAFDPLNPESKTQQEDSP